MHSGRTQAAAGRQDEREAGNRHATAGGGLGDGSETESSHQYIEAVAVTEC